jgi:hypothetical protein
VRDQIRFLANELTTMHASLLKMSEEEEHGHDPLDKAWMKEVKVYMKYSFSLYLIGINVNEF